MSVIGDKIKNMASGKADGKTNTQRLRSKLKTKKAADTAKAKERAARATRKKKTTAAAKAAKTKVSDGINRMRGKPTSRAVKKSPVPKKRSSRMSDSAHNSRQAALKKTAARKAAKSKAATARKKPR